MSASRAARLREQEAAASPAASCAAPGTRGVARLGPGASEILLQFRGEVRAPFTPL
jgi:hypothetical protein